MCLKTPFLLPTSCLNPFWSLIHGKVTPRPAGFEYIFGVILLAAGKQNRAILDFGGLGSLRCGLFGIDLRSLINQCCPLLVINKENVSLFSTNPKNCNFCIYNTKKLVKKKKKINTSCLDKPPPILWNFQKLSLFLQINIHTFKQKCIALLRINLECRQHNTSKLFCNVGVCLSDMGRAVKVHKALIMAMQRLWCQLPFSHFVCQGLWLNRLQRLCVACDEGWDSYIECSGFHPVSSQGCIYSHFYLLMYLQSSFLLFF